MNLFKTNSIKKVLVILSKKKVLVMSIFGFSFPILRDKMGPWMSHLVVIDSIHALV